MITDAFITIITNIVQFIIGLFPAYTGLPTQLDSGLTWILGLLNDIGGFIPLDTFFTILGLIVSLETGILLFRFFAWVFKWNIHATNTAT